MAADPRRYDRMMYRRCGRSGLVLPAISLGLWHGFAGYSGIAESRNMVLGAFDLGINHFDLANNYGEQPGESERLFGRILKELPRDEVLVSTKAGFPMWPGPFGDGGSRKSIVASCDQSLHRLGLDYVDIFYSHRPDDKTPIEETLDALATLVRQGKALYAGLSNYPDPVFSRTLQVARSGPPMIINQAFYSMLDRAAETDVLPTAAREGLGVIAYSPHVQGLLTDRYLAGIPAESRIGRKAGNGAIQENWITPELRQVLVRLDAVARGRGQSLAQMALSWLLRRPELTSVLIGASRLPQIQECVGCLERPSFADGELREIDAILALPRRS